jgi:hypothetical protein
MIDIVEAQLKARIHDLGQTAVLSAAIRSPL